MSANSSYAEYYPYHGDLGRIPWERTTDEDERYLNERIKDLETRRVYVCCGRKTIDWRATYAWIQEGASALPQPPFPYLAYTLDTETVPHHPRIKKIKNAQQLPASHAKAAPTSHAKAKNIQRRWGHITYGKSSNEK